MADDPFEMFRRAVEQFDPGEGFDPATFGALGWPMTPFPARGVGPNPLSPEAGTKHALTQLFTAIEELSEGPVSTGDAPVEVWQRYAEQFDAGGFEPANTAERVGTMVAGTYQVWLYSLAQLLVEAYTLRLLFDRLVVEEHRERLGTQEWLWELAQSDREQLLLRCTDIDDDLVEEMQAIRSRRNELFYDLGSWDRITRKDPVGEARRYLRVLTELDALVSEGDGYRFLPGDRAAGT